MQWLRTWALGLNSSFKTLLSSRFLTLTLNGDVQETAQVVLGEKPLQRGA